MKVCVTNAQISAGLYKALPDTLKPRQKTVITGKEKQRILSSVDNFDALPFRDELGAMAGLLDKETKVANNLALQISNTQALASYYGTFATDSSIFYNKLLAAFTSGKKEYDHVQADAWQVLGLMYCYQDQYDSAITSLHRAMILKGGEKDSSFLKTTNNTYCILYARLMLYEKAIYYGQQAIQYFPAAQRWDTEYVQQMLTNSVHYSTFYKQDRQPRYADSAYKIIKEVMRHKKDEAAYWYGACYYFLGYLDYLQGNYLEAIAMLDSSMLQAYNERSRYFANNHNGKYLYKAICLIKLGEYGRSQAILDTLVIPDRQFSRKQLLYESLSEIASATGRFKDAYEYYKQFKTYSDSMDIEGQKGKVFEAEQKYAVAQKEASITRLENENLQEKNARRTLVIIALLVIIILASIILIYYFYNRGILARRVAERERLAEKLADMEKEMEARQASQNDLNKTELALLRKNISQDMHDEISGSVASLRFIIQDHLANAKDVKTVELLEGLEDEASTVYAQVREFMHRLREGGTVFAYDVTDFLQNLSITFGEGSSLIVAASCDEESVRAHYTAQQHAGIYLFIKEAVTNCMKHATASKISIEVTVKEGMSQIYIADNGKGMNGTSRGIGIESMEERIGLLGGEVKFWSNDGLHIQARFPIEHGYIKY